MYDEVTIQLRRVVTPEVTYWDATCYYDEESGVSCSGSNPEEATTRLIEELISDSVIKGS